MWYQAATKADPWIRRGVPRDAWHHVCDSCKGWRSAASGLQDGGKWNKEDICSVVAWQIFLPVVFQVGKGRGKFMGKQRPW